MTNCIWFYLSGQLLRFIHGNMSPSASRRLRDHLKICSRCRLRARLLRARNSIPSVLQSFAPRNDPWPRIEAAIRKPMKSGAPRHLYASKAFWVGAAVALIIPMIFLIWKNTNDPSANQSLEPAAPAYHEVPIRQMPVNTEPRVMTEGYVIEVKIDNQEGNLKFKLVESLHSSSPFVVCEIIEPLKLKLPEVGRKVRVYGISRYDAKADHQWYEVHPVTAIENLPMTNF